VGELAALTAVFMGPGRLLVTAHVVPVADSAAGPAADLVARVADLRADLLTADVISAVEITVVPAGS